MLSRSESDEINPNDLIAILIQSEVIPCEDKLHLGMTSMAHRENLLNWLLGNLTILNHPKHACILSFLENIIALQDEQAEDIASRVMCGLSWSKAGMFNIDVLNRLVEKIRDSNATDVITENSAFTNAAFFGNHHFISVLLDKGFRLPPRIYQKAKGDYLDAIEKGKYREDDLLICKTIIEHELRDILCKVKTIIKTHPFVLNGGGDHSIPEIGHAVTTHAAKVFNMIDAALQSNLSLTGIYYQLATDIIRALRVQEKGWFSAVGLFTARGERHPSTSDCYEKITRVMVEGLVRLSELTNLAEAKINQTSPTRDLQVPDLQVPDQKSFSC